MVNELQLYSDPAVYSGDTVIARLYQDGAQIGGNISTTEVGVSGNFLGNMPAGSPGDYVVIFYDSSIDIIGQGEISWDGSNELYLLAPEVSEIRSEMEKAGTKLTAVKDKTDNMPALPAATGEYNTQMGYIPTNLGDVPTATELNSDHGTGSWEGATVPTVGAIADAVWDEDLTEHTTVNTAGKILKQIKSTVGAILGLIS